MLKLFKTMLVIAWVALALGFAWMIFFSDKGLVALDLSRAKKHEIMLQNQVLNQQNSILAGEIERLRTDLEYIEDVARYDLGMVGQDEIIYKP